MTAARRPCEGVRSSFLLVDGETNGGGTSSVASQELQEHQMYLAFKKSGKKKYERQFVEREFLLSDVQREETPKEEGKCLKCGYFSCACGALTRI